MSLTVSVTPCGRRAVRYRVVHGLRPGGLLHDLVSAACGGVELSAVPKLQAQRIRLAPPSAVAWNSTNGCPTPDRLLVRPATGRDRRVILR